MEIQEQETNLKQALVITPILGTETIGKVYDVPREFNFKWRIEDFFSIPEEAGKHYLSPSFLFAGESWFLKIYPHGKTVKHSGFIGLYLFRELCDPPISLVWSFGLKTYYGKKDEETQFTFVFGKKAVGRGNPGLWKRPMPSKQEYQLLSVSGTLTIVCNMKSYSKSTAAEICSLGSSTNPHENKILHDFKKLFLEKEDCDVVLKVQGLEFPAHRTILKARSSVFASTFRIDMKEKKTGVVEIEDCDPSSFSDFLRFLYCGDTEVISEENVFSLFFAADKYDIQDLRAKCLEFIKANLCVDTFCDTITLALWHSERELIKLTTDFFIANASEIILTVKWQSFLAESPTESNELLVKFFVYNSSNSSK